MKVLFLTSNGEWLPIAWRLRRAGIDAVSFIMDPRYRGAYRRIIPLVTETDLRKEAAEADTIVLDIKSDESVIEELKVSGKKVIHTGSWLKDFEAVQNHYLMDGDLGPKVPAQGTMIRFDTEAGVQGRSASRVTCDAVFAMCSLARDMMDLFTSGVRDFKDHFCAAQRVTVPPYPYIVDSLMTMTDKVSVMAQLEKEEDFWALDIYRSNDGFYRCNGADGFLGVVTGAGPTPQEAWGKCYSNLRRIRISGARPQYRKDGLKSATRKTCKRQSAVGSSDRS